MNWNDYFDKIYVINLPERTDRLKQATEELGKYGIPFEVWPGIKCENGQLGIYATIYNLIEKSYYEGLSNILIFEDDVKLLINPEEYFSRIPAWVTKRHASFDILYLGLNTDEKPLGKCIGIDKAFIEVKYAYGCHAMCISREGMFQILKVINENSNIFINPGSSRYTKFYKELDRYWPIDKLIAQKIQSRGKCICTYPMLATQRNSYSDIEKKEVDQSYLETRFIESTKHLV